MSKGVINGRIADALESISGNLDGIGMDLSSPSYTAELDGIANAIECQTAQIKNINEELVSIRLVTLDKMCDKLSVIADALKDIRDYKKRKLEIKEFQ